MKKLRSLKTRLKIGQKVELEHGDNPKKAKKIAMDHIKELPDYYRRLVKMEKKGKKEWGIEEADRGEAIMALRRSAKKAPGQSYNAREKPPLSAISSYPNKKLLKKEEREELISSIVEYAMVWGAPPPSSPKEQIERIRKLLS